MARKTPIQKSVNDVVKLAVASGKPLAIVLAGHNGSGKSTMWYEHVVDDIRIPLINADRMMLSILPEKDRKGLLRPWAQALRDTDTMWMQVAQKGVESFVAQAMANQVPFATETVFSHWRALPGGGHESKIDLIRNLQAAGYFVVLLFVGLSSAALSLGRVATRVAAGGHDVGEQKILARFPRTQKAIGAALTVADAAVLVDNSRDLARAFTPCYVRTQSGVLFDIRSEGKAPQEITAWLDVVAPQVKTA
ncbi:zeta toxin family protein [Burkholderia sp. Ac-20353]|uniref:zeta toxin family protein n=1 Tax=Burkholderia sp. Ac-20353 TaxID=2703894 RepID=UPI00197B27AF|nr:zeta toxin family protein [Burkholderia sp. Ac-20353]MBN3786041.1 toxin [Burkholderia sp. Ac-20353]